MWNTPVASGNSPQTSLAESDGRMSEQASLVQQFINYLRAERHFSPHTAKCYAADLQQTGKSPCKPIKLEDGFDLSFFEPDGQRSLVFDESAVEAEEADNQ